MLIGHYAVAPLAASGGRIKLWQGFLAVQVVDFIWVALTLLEVEKVRIVSGFTAANDMDLYFMPYSHSLLFSLFWSAISALIFKFLSKSNDWRGSVLFGLLVLSHWITDIPTHVADLTFWPGSEKIGFGLWNNVAASFLLELAMVVIGFGIYFKRRGLPTHDLVRFAILGLTLLLAHLGSYFGNSTGSASELALNGLFVFSILPLLAWWYERSSASLEIQKT